MATSPTTIPLPSLFGGEVAVASVPTGPDYRDGPCFATDLAAYRRTVASIRKNPWTHLPPGLAMPQRIRASLHDPHGLRRDYLKPPARLTLAAASKALARDYPAAMAWVLKRRAALGLASPGEILHFAPLTGASGVA